MSTPPLTPAARAELRAAIDARRRILVADEPGERDNRSRQLDTVRRHGTEAAYLGGCRCDGCRAASASARRARRKHPNPSVHGTSASYSNGCRCDDCRHAARLRAR